MDINQDNINQKLSLDTVDPDKGKIDLDTGASFWYQSLSPDIINKRSDKAFHSLGDVTGQSKTDIQSSIASGDESRFRQTAAAAVDFTNARQREGMFKQITSPQQLDSLKRWNVAPQDPNTVIEDNWSQWFSNSKSPLFQFREYVNTQAENADAARSNQGWTPWLLQQAENLVPGLYEARMRWTANDTPSMFKGLLGDEKAAIADDIYSDPNTAREKFDKAMGSLEGNPSLQSDFAHAVLGQTKGEKLLNNAFTLIDISTIPGAIKGIKLGSGLAQSILEYNSAKRSIRSLYETAAQSNDGAWKSPKVAKAAGEGNVNEAAVQKTSEDLIKLSQGTSDTTKEIIEDLSSAQQINVNALEAGGSGRFGNNLITTIKEDMNSFGRNVMQMLQNTMRVNRTPVMEASKDVVKQLREAMRGRYKGPGNTLIDTEYNGHEPLSNSYFFTHIMGTEDMEPFETAQQANNAARRYGYPSADTVRERINREVGPKLTELDFKIKEITDRRKEPPSIEADVHELNYWNDLDRKLQELSKQRDDLMAYHAEHLVGPDIKIPGAQIREIGKGKYVIAYHVPQSEVDNIMRDGLINLPSSYTGKAKKGRARFGTQIPGIDARVLPEGTHPEAPLVDWDAFHESYADRQWHHISSTLAWLRTPGETLSPAEISQRVIATHGAGQFLKIAQENSRIIRQVPKKYRKDFQKVLAHNQDMMDPHDGLPGYYFETLPQLEEHYISHIGRSPSAEEARAYWANKNNWDYDRILRSLLSLRNKNRAGVESHSISYRDGKTGEKFDSPYFDAISQNHLPGGHDLVAIMGDGISDTSFHYADSKSFTAKSAKLLKDIQEGRKQVVEIHDVQARPIAKFLDDNRAVRYVITDKFNRKQLQFNDQIGRRGGGHWDHDYEWAVKQANMVPEKAGSRFRDRYEGDTFVSWVDNHAMGKEFMDHLNRVRELMEQSELEQAEKYHKSHFDFRWEDHRSSYYPKKVDGVIQPPLFSTKEPFQLVRKDKKIADIDNTLRDRYKGTFYDATREGSVARTQQIQYTGPRDSRDVLAVTRKGDWRNPVFGYDRAKFVDPFTTMDRGLSRIVNSSFMEDYKLMGAEHWLRNAAKWLNTEDSLLRDAPWHVFNTFDPKTSFVKDTPDDVKRLLTNNWKKITDFVGMPSETDRFLQRTAEGFSNMLYGKTGMILPSSALPKLTNPLQFLRSAVFDMKFLYSPGTFFTQFSTFVNVAAINLKYAPATVGAMTMHNLARINAKPEILARMGKIMEAFGWRPGEFEEARKAALEWSNFTHIGQEHAFLDSFVQNRTITNQWHNVQYWGRRFFEEGANSTRVAAFYSAYRQFKDLNPTELIGRQEKEWIMSRAADLDHNMSRAFNSSLHTKYASFFGQFYAYAMRLSELMTGKRLTTAEKIRLGTVSSVMWGVPMGGAGLYAFPFGDEIRKEAVANYGYAPGNHLWSSVLMEGVPAVMHSMITGKWYDYSKFGTKGIDPFLDFVEGDKNLWEVFGGATVQTLANGWRALSPVIHSLADIWDGKMKLTWRDLIRPLQEYSAINDEERMRYAFNTGKWISKNETYLTDVDQASAWFMTMTGMTQTNIVDTAILNKAKKAEGDSDSFFINNYVREINRANLALSNNNKTEHEEHLKNAQVWADKIPLDKLSQAMSSARSSMTPAIDRARWKYFHTDVPRGQEKSRSDSFNEQQGNK